MSPLEIKVALHYYSCADSYPWNDSDAQNSIITRFHNNGFLVEYDRGVESAIVNPDFVATGKLRAYCDALTMVKEPVQTWVIPGE